MCKKKIRESRFWNEKCGFSHVFGTNYVVFLTFLE